VSDERDHDSDTPALSEADRDADRRRLDWLEARHAIDIVCYPPDVGPTFATVRYTVEAWGVRRVEARGLGPTLRAAVDAAMAEWAARGGGESDG
jgi:hypothetical protein